MQETMQALRGLQELDEDLFRVHQELERLPQERERRRAGITAKEQQVAVLERQLLDKRMRTKEVEDLTRAHRQRIRKLESEIQTARDGALIAAYQHEMRSLKREVSDAEEEGLGYVEEAEGLEAERDRLKTEIEAEEETFREYTTNVDNEIAEATRKRDELLALRKERMSSSLEPDVLSKYERLLAAREGVALAALEGRICQVCFMEVPPNVFVRLARSTEIVTCPSCDRILYLSQ